MDPVRNPFVPGAGTPPPELAGREDVLGQARVALARIRQGRPSRSLMLFGLRGVGKTVLLNRIQENAKSDGYRAILIEAREGRHLAALLLPPLRQLLLALDRLEGINEQVKRGLRVLKSFAGAVKVNLGDVELSLDIDPEQGAADSGDLETDLADLLVAIAQAAASRNTAVAIIMDELQYVPEPEFGALLASIHKITQKSLPLTLIGAGLPQLVGNAGKAKAYAECLFEFLEIGALPPNDAREALQEPVQREGVSFTPEALDRIIAITQGYPYFLQEWGYQCWDCAPSSPISLDLVQAATGEAIRKLDEGFFRVRWNRLTPKEREYLFAMAQLGPGPHRSGDIAQRLGQPVHAVAALRNGIIKKGMVYSPAHGETAFTVPLFDEYLKRMMPASPSADGVAYASLCP